MNAWQHKPSEFAGFSMSWAESYMNHIAGQNIVYG